MYSNHHYKFYRGKMTRADVDFMVSVLAPTPSVTKGMYGYFVEGKTVKELRVNTSDLIPFLHQGMQTHREKRTVKHRHLFLCTNTFNPWVREDVTL
jgi:ABC-type phosphate transport system permease subunit